MSKVMNVNYFKYNCRWVPESARWLLANGKVDRAQYYLDKCAEFNKRQKLSSKLKLEVGFSLILNGAKDFCLFVCFFIVIM